MARRDATRAMDQPAGPVTVSLPHLWTPRTYQYDLIKAMPANRGHVPADRTKDRFVLVWHRKAGKDLTALALTTREMYARPGYYVHILPTFKQAKAILWDGMDDKGVPFMARFPESIIKSKSETELQVVLKPFPGQPSGSIWQLRGADDPDSLRGPNYVGAVFSEYSEMDPMVWTAVVQPVLEQNGGWAMFIYTPKGRNHSHDLYQMAKADPRWFVQLLTIDDTKRDAPGEDKSPCVTLERIEQLRKEGTPEELIQQEYYCSFTGFLRGTIFGDLITAARKESRVRRIPFDNRYPVGTIWDIGRADATAIWFYQRIGTWIRFIDYFESGVNGKEVNKGADYWASEVRKTPYIVSKCILPHDAKIKGYTATHSTEEFLRRIFRRVTVADKPARVQQPIDMTRRLFPRFEFDEVKCARGIEAIENYRRKYNEELHDYSGEPIHDEFSHGAAALYTGVYGGIDAPLDFIEGRERSAPTQCLTDFSVFENSTEMVQ